MIRVDAAQLRLADWIRPGDGIVMGQGTAEPLTLTEALVRQRGELGGVRAFLAAMFSDTFQPGAVDGIALHGMGGVGTNRRLIACYDQATARGIGTIDFEGKMIDGPLLKRAQRMVALGEHLRRTQAGAAT